MTARRPVVVTTLVLILAACSPAAVTLPSASAAATTTAGASLAPTPPAGSTDLTIFGAASLRNVLEQVKVAYETAHPGTTLTISTDASSTLATQIEQGAPADVFLSADTANPRKLVDAGFTEGDALTFAGNELAVIVPTDNPARIATPADLAGPGVKVIAAGDQVPVTIYASLLVDQLADESGYPADFAAGYAANVVSREDNVKAVVAKIELGEGDAGIVYATDAAASTKVRRIDVPATANVLARYAGVVIKATPDLKAARAFLTWVAGPGGQEILGSFGFLPPS